MTHTSLPPRGIFMPTHLIFHPELPSAVLVTWIKLRCLAWAGWDTPPMNLPQLAAHVGIHPARLNRHLAQLQEVSALLFRRIDTDKLIISFTAEPAFTPENLNTDQHAVKTGFLASPPQPGSGYASYFPARIMGYLSYEDDEDASYLPASQLGSPLDRPLHTMYSHKVPALFAT